MKPKSLIVLDCDGVLVDSERIIQDVDIRMISELGWPITRTEIFEQHLGRTEQDVTANIEQVLGRPVPTGFDERRRAAYASAFEAELTAVDGVHDALQQLTAAGHEMCVASSGSHDRMQMTLGITKLDSRFRNTIYSAEDVARGKPAPDLFLHAARSMGYAPAACVVVEDSPSGVRAALAAGMRAIGFAGLTPSSYLADAHAVITSMQDLPRTVQRLSSTRADEDRPATRPVDEAAKRT